MIELLAPAGSYDSLCAAVNAGADAVYIGGSMFGARAYADNPSEEQLIEGIEYCHLHGRKIYLTVNTLLKEKELESQLYEWLLPYYEHGVDALIVQDLGVVQFIQAHFPGLAVHASTQMTLTGADGAGLLKELGAERVVLARELHLDEIREVIRETKMEVETFIHGAMCYCYSGQCLFSSILGGRSGNRGRCAQPCRLKYTVQGKTSHLLSMKDMCALDLLPDLIDAGIASLKIEGRMKRPEYTAGVVSIYRKYIDRYVQDGRERYRVEEDDRLLLMDLYNRGGFSDGYYRLHNGRGMMATERPNHMGTKAARITDVKKGQLSAKALEELNPGDVLELFPGRDVTLSGSVSRGSHFNLPVSLPRRKAGHTIYRTKNEKLLADLSRQYLQTKCKEKIKGDLKISADGSAILKLTCGDVCAEVSEQIAQPAQSNPASVCGLERQMNKLGNTPFVFEALSIKVDDGLFVPVSSLNELRRRGTALLEQKILESFRRSSHMAQPYQAVPGERRDLAVQRGASCRPTVCVTDVQQLEAVFAFWEEHGSFFDTVYLDSLFLANSDSDLKQTVEKIHEAGGKCFLSFPPVFRRMDRALMESEKVQKLFYSLDGVLLHTLDQLAYILAFQKRTGVSLLLAADDTLYAYNKRAVQLLRSQGIDRFTLPGELNFHELCELATDQAELNIYGRQSLMQSAQCVVKNIKGCQKKTHLVFLQDRKSACFPVLNRCIVCCNTIYNSVPLELGGCKKEIDRLSPSFVRLSFTVETYQETAAVLQRYSEALAGQGQRKEFEGTRGHFRRGVE